MVKASITALHVNLTAPRLHPLHGPDDSFATHTVAYSEFWFLWAIPNGRVLINFLNSSTTFFAQNRSILQHWPIAFLQLPSNPTKHLRDVLNCSVLCYCLQPINHFYIYLTIMPYVIHNYVMRFCHVYQMSQSRHATNEAFRLEH